MNIEETLSKAPERLKTLSTEYFELREKKDELDGACEARRIKYTGDVEEDAGKEENKKALSNVTKRSVEITSRLGRDEEYTANSAMLTALKRKMCLKEIEIQFEDRMFKAARALASLRSN